jgi:23S rRNA (uracil1939-C5)-methyltransferase
MNVGTYQSYRRVVRYLRGMRMKGNPVYEKVEIVAASSEGKSLARIDNVVVFVNNAVPGDVVDVKIMRKHRRFLEGTAIHFHTLSKDRVEPVCTHFGTCGGCKWQSLNYQTQLKYKQQQVHDALVRIGKLEVPEFQPIVGPKEVYNYRNRLDFGFSDKKWLTIEEIQSGVQIEDRSGLGFHISGAFDKVLDLKECHLQGPFSEAVRKFVREYTRDKKYPYFNIRDQHGLMRSLIIRTSSTGETMVIVQFFDNNKEQIEDVMSAIHKQFPEITSLLYIINPKGNDTYFDLPVNVYAGRDHMFESMEGLKFRIGPKSFYQTNSAQAYELYKITREFAGLTGNEVVYDLYTGTGTIAQFVSSQAKKVIGVELVPSAIADAKENAGLNGITNCSFFASDMKDIFNAHFMNEHGKPDVIITDPPRAGMHEDVCKAISDSGAARVVYVSCNPASQARDLAILSERYTITKVQPVDMFPQTHHVENVVCLEIRA